MSLRSATRVISGRIIMDGTTSLSNVVRTDLGRTPAEPPRVDRTRSAGFEWDECQSNPTPTERGRAGPGRYGRWISGTVARAHGTGGNGRECRSGRDPWGGGVAGGDGTYGRSRTHWSQGAPGLPGANYTINTTLEHGQTESGAYSAWGGGSGTYFASLVNFRIPLEADLPSGNTTFIPAGGAYTTNCAGPGEALPGQLCIYQVYNSSSSFLGIINPVSALYGASSLGFSVFFEATATQSWSYGSWTVAAP